MSTRTKEQVYDAEIDPVMKRILAICKRERIAMIADFLIGDDFHCTSALVTEEYNPSENQLAAYEFIQPHSQE